MDDIDPMDAAVAIRDKLAMSLEDFDASSVLLSRDEAILTIGLISALIDAMETDMARRPGRSN